MKNSVKFDAVRENSVPEVLIDQIMKQIKSGNFRDCQTAGRQGASTYQLHEQIFGHFLALGFGQVHSQCCESCRLH